MDFLLTKPRGLVKDYYIWRYLDQNITPKQAQQALEQTWHVNTKIFFRYAKRSKDPAIERIALCMRLPAKKLATQDSGCIAAGITPSKFLRLDRKSKKSVLAKIDTFPSIELNYLIDPYSKPIKDPKKFLTLFFATSDKKSHFDYPIDEDFAKALSKQWAFPRFVRTVLSQDLKKTAYSLLLLDPQKLDASSDFYLGLVAYRADLPNIATSFLRISRKKSYYQHQKDRADFWLYKTTHHKRYLESLLQSWDLNFYTILAKEMAGQKDLDYIIPVLKGKKDINLSDPFVWEKIQKEPHKKEEFAYRNTQNLYAWLLEKESKYREHPYILPYERYLADQNVSQKALLYALARQESRFIPGSISRSFALGPLQFMPFLAKHMARKSHIQNFDLDMMFLEPIAIGFAKRHLKYLAKHLHHPLLISYAYNGGIGYTKREILPLFEKYDPLLAMEMVSYPETKEYGKKVLANFVVYKKILGDPVSLRYLLKSVAAQSRNLCLKR